MSYIFGALAVIAFFVGLAGAVNVHLPIAVLGFGGAVALVGCVLVAERLRNRGVW